MAQLPQAANTAENHATGGFESVPSGVYEVALRKSEWRDTKSGNGKYIYMEFVILEGEYKGSVLFERLNLVNPNATAVRIATQTMNQICKAAHKTDIEDTDELLNIPIEVTVETTHSEEWGDQSEIKKYASADGSEFEAPWD